MKIAALYDIHGNLPALRAVLAEVAKEGVDLIVFGGDVVLGPMPEKCLDRIEKLNVSLLFVRGNCEDVILAKPKSVLLHDLPDTVIACGKHNFNELTIGQRKELSTWQNIIHQEHDYLGELIFCHATPRSNKENFTKISPLTKLQEIFNGVESDVVICGHTHMQFDIQIDGLRVVNAGSVGMSFGRPGAHWLLIEEDIAFKVTQYDLNSAAEELLMSSYPDTVDFVNKYVLNTPSEAVMLKMFEGINW